MITLIKLPRVCYPLFVILLMFFFFQNTAFAVEKIVGMGDSITAGYPLITSDQNGSQVGGYEPILANMLIHSGQQAVVLNYGHRGELSVEGNNRIQGVLDTEKPDVVLVLEGVNDLFAVDTATVMTNLASMVNKVIQSGAYPVIATLLPDTYDTKPVKQMNDLIRNWAKNNNVQLADQYMALINDWSQLTFEGMHPNLDGYNVMAQTWFTVISMKTFKMTQIKRVNMTPIMMLLLK
ncbi:MAG: SGNH/GDSL hydrolase family protein [Deltaproteobacteria bacterium]|nr:SGNH/GDSL hydrolase family protein [Deltaproteobacteria bacterium]